MMAHFFGIFQLIQYLGVPICILGLFAILTIRGGMVKIYALLAQLTALIGVAAYILQVKEMNSVPNYRLGLIVFATECLVPYFALLAVTEYRESPVEGWMKAFMLGLDVLAVLAYATNQRLHIMYLQTNFTTNGKFNYYSNIHGPFGWMFIMVIVLQLFAVCVNCMLLTGKRLLHFAGILPLVFMILCYMPFMEGFNTNQWSFIGSSLFLAIYLFYRAAERKNSKEKTNS